MKKIILLVVAVAFSAFVRASSELEDKQNALNMVKQYSALVSCMNSFEKDPENGSPTTLNDVHTVEYDKEDNSYVFYVLWSGDKGCAGGSGTMSNFVTEVARYGGAWKPYTVQTDYAFGEDVGVNYGYIESIKKINSHKFELIGWDHADSKYGGVDGGSNFPANKFKYTLEREQFEPWKVTHQALLEQRK
ncbi:hypothetical protein ACWEZX_06940 [Acinetobacter baumannii]